MNTSTDEKTVDPKKFSERTGGFNKARNIINSSTNQLSGDWKIPGKTIWILELEK